jgi:NADH-quinone oxidoreductase subunit N
VNGIDINLPSLLPVAILVLTGMTLMVLDPFLPRESRAKLGWIGLVGVAAAALALAPMSGALGTWYSGLWWVDGYAIFLHATFLAIAGLTLLMAHDYLRREGLPPSEFVVLILFATTGGLIMSAAGELMLMFVGIEILSMGTYVLAGYRRHELRSNESALKYFLLGSFASAFFLYGVALIFGATGSTNLAFIGEAIRSGAAPPELVLPAAGLILTGLAFKVALAPFHVWAPDVYEGAPTPVTGFMSAGPRVAGFAVMIRILTTAFPALDTRWVWALWALAALTMIVGNVVALVQPGIKRMLAYSSIAHAGYVAVALASRSGEGNSAALFYLFVYSIASLGTFAVVTLVGGQGERRLAVRDYRGPSQSQPLLAGALALFLLSLGGIPATAGFTGKFFIFRAAIDSGLVGLAVIGVLSTVVSFYFYLYVIVEMYMREPDDASEVVPVPIATGTVVAVAALLTLGLGFLPSPLLDWATRSVAGAIAMF